MSMQYTATCPGCRAAIALTRAQIETGRNPVCEHCGSTMTVHAQAGRTAPLKTAASQ